MSVLAASKERLVFSRTAKDESGTEMPESVYFTTLWRLVGLPTAGTEIDDGVLDPYERWRLTEEQSQPDTQKARYYTREWAKRQTADKPFDRRPFSGESYFGVLPTYLCRAQDEVLQTLTSGGGSIESSDDPLLASISRGLEAERERTRFFDHVDNEEEDEVEALMDPECDTSGFIGVLPPEVWERFKESSVEIPELSPSSLQNLAICAYRYYLQRILRLEPVQTNELEESAADYGNAIHSVMNIGMRLLRGDAAETVFSDQYSVSGAPVFRNAMNKIVAEYAYLMQPHYAQKTEESWTLNTEHSADAAQHYPVAVLQLEDDMETYAAFFVAICNAMQDAVSAGESTLKLGAPEQVELIWNRIRTSVRNLLVAQAETTKQYTKKKFTAGNGLAWGDEELIRTTALIEEPFFRDDAVEITNPEDDSEKMRLHGLVDRIDLLFSAETKELRAIHVIDYKGSGKKGRTPATLADEIVALEDAQLPAYALMARKKLFPAGADIPVVMNYLVYSATLKEMKTNIWNHIITDGGYPDGGGLEMPDLMDQFKAGVFETLDILKHGRFAVKSTSCHWCDFKSQCRYPNSDLKKEGGDE